MTRNKGCTQTQSDREGEGGSMTLPYDTARCAGAQYDGEWREAAEEALRWMEHARLHLTIKERMHPDGLSLYDSAAEALRAALAKPEVEPPRDEWREAVRDEWRPASEPPEDGRR